MTIASKDSPRDILATAPPATAGESPAAPAPAIARHVNNIGFLRLVLASLVIFAHSPEIIDGDHHREPLSSIFGTISFGALAVDFFFIISGFLITASYFSSVNVWSYLWKRVLRIYPAFVTASLVCILVVGPLAGGDLRSLGPREILLSLVRILDLAPPKLAGAFTALPYPALNGPMWTIRYEFHCYLLVGLLGVLGLLRRRYLMLAGTLLLLAAHAWLRATNFDLTWGPLSQTPGIDAILLDPQQNVRMMALFGCGICFRLFRDRIPLRAEPAMLCLAAAVALLFSDSLVQVGLGTVGAYFIFWLAGTQRFPIMSKINNSYDISYGVYLYGWPIGSLIALYFMGITPVALTVATLLLAILAGAISWIVVEKPFLKLKSVRAKT
jgi:peptidoglycan/LPS O-acetylase OafA/YrhL